MTPRAEMFDDYPKMRPPLPEAAERIYDSYYRENRLGRTPAYCLAQKAESWLHRQVARDVVLLPGPRSTLEIGAGTLNQLLYEPHAGPYDVVEPFRDLYAGSPLLGRVRDVYADIGEVPADRRYDRITSVAAFEHICNLPEVAARCGLLLEKGGCLRVSIPSEGTLLWALGWRLTTGLEFRFRHGLDYGLIMRHEHVNTAREVADVLGFFFPVRASRVLGVTPALSLYQYHECREPDLERCAAYLRRVGRPVP